MNPKDDRPIQAILNERVIPENGKQSLPPTKKSSWLPLTIGGLVIIGMFWFLIIRSIETERAVIRAHYAPEHDPKMNDEIVQLEFEVAVKKHQLMPGMNESQTVASWGEPERKNEIVTPSGKSSQWVYSENRFVNFSNGRITTIQTLGK